jgi:4-amino-4-deoxy-L-arabinose transferase-like glycosyltransferase
MISTNLNWLVGGAVLGLVIGLAITVPAHNDNPFLAAPGVFLGLLVAALGSIVSVSLLLFFKKRGGAVVGLTACFVMMLAVLTLLPLAWPYPKADGPRPLTDGTHAQ